VAKTNQEHPKIIFSKTYGRSSDENAIANTACSPTSKIWFTLDLFAQYKNALVSLGKVPLTGFALLKASNVDEASKEDCLNARTDCLKISEVIGPV